MTSNLSLKSPPFCSGSRGPRHLLRVTGSGGRYPSFFIKLLNFVSDEQTDKFPDKQRSGRPWRDLDLFRWLLIWLATFRSQEKKRKRPEQEKKNFHWSSGQTFRADLPFCSTWRICLFSVTIAQTNSCSLQFPVKVDTRVPWSLSSPYWP